MKWPFVLAALAGVAAIMPAEVIRVPGEYETIQAGINAASADDTVLVSPGVYAEAVVIATGILLRGDAVPDTGDYPRPVIDPSTLANPHSQRCVGVFVPGVVIEEFVFRNGAEMYPHEAGPGGVSNVAAGTVFRRCKFDSTFHGVVSVGLPVTLEQCEFRQIPGRCIHTGMARLDARDCIFTGPTAWPRVECGANSILEGCHTRDTSGEGGLWTLFGPGVTVRNCIFGPARTRAVDAIDCYWSQLFLFENNVFTDMELGGSVIGGPTNCACDSPCVIRGNQFINNVAREDLGQGGNRVNIGCTEVDSCASIIAENNVFAGGRSRAGTKALFVYAGDMVRMNRFVGMMPAEFPAVYGTQNGAECHENIFAENGLAAGAATEVGVTFDAGHNWWGDGSGPYHQQLNPQGRGDSVGNGVRFEPWHEDTLFWNDVVERRPPIAKQVDLQVFPNPFNDEATLRLRVSKPLILRLELYDLMGRRVREIWSGATGLDKEFHIGGSDLSSGIYYVRAWDVLERRPLAMEKAVLIR